MDREETIRIMRQIVREEIGRFSKSDAYIFDKNIRIGDGRKIIIPGDNGVKFGDSALAKIGFYNTAPVVQQTPSASNEVTANDGTALNNNSTSTGSLGSTAYRFAEVVSALKNLGLIAQ